jgi:hypothetical protein
MRSVISGRAFAVLVLMTGAARAEDAASSIVGVWKLRRKTDPIDILEQSRPVRSRC